MDNIKEILSYIDPGSLNYTEWLQVGMALQSEGYPSAMWEEWSRKDYSRFHEGECEEKWQSFRGNPNPVTIGTLIHMATENGFRRKESYELAWDSIITDDYVIVDQNWLEDADIKEPTGIWEGYKETIRYLESLFAPEEYVAYVMQSYDSHSGKKSPGKGNYSRTAAELISELKKYKDIGSSLGDYDTDTGAWICFNPVDGKGRNNANITDYRYALVESDSLSIEKQYAIMKELCLPIKILIHSGGKSLHAIVKINAVSEAEYRRRVDHLYTICQKNGLDVDKQNRNVSRLSRLPGVYRGENKQFIVEENLGKSTWEEWAEWIQSVNDELPDPESLGDVWGAMPPLAPELIKGVLRQGHKMLLAGASKAGKSFSLIELCICIAEGTKWLGRFETAQGRVLYVNLELDRASCLNRFKEVYGALGLHPDNLGNIDIWNLRGKAVPMTSLAPKLIRRAAKKGYIAVIIDPIYKVITGDENSADQMALFCNQFDRIATELNTACIYCHHHSKGAQGGKKSADRASGSGVFARDPDALLDMIELNVTEEAIAKRKTRKTMEIYERYLREVLGRNRFESMRDELTDVPKMYSAVMQYIKDHEKRWALQRELNDLESRMRSSTAWRIEGTLREFPSFEPVDVWFEYPVHKADDDGILKNTHADGEEVSAEEKKEKKAKEQAEDIDTAFELLNEDGIMQIDDFAEYIGMTRRTAIERARRNRNYEYSNGEIRRRQNT
jgi:RecA-family ATPase